MRDDAAGPRINPMKRRLVRDLTALLLGVVSTPIASPLVAIAQSPTERTTELYRQRFSIRFRDAGAAQRAALSIAPLYGNHKRAVSCRWDDNWTSDNLKTRDVMQEHGIRGTWYLNGRSFHPNGGGGDYLPVAEQLIAGGNSIGCHSMTHPFLTYFHTNRMFAETALCRVVWEAALDRPVVSYAYSFVDLSPAPEGKRVLLRTLETLRRAGFHHVSEYLSFFDGVDLQLELSPILPPENTPFDEFEKALRWAYSDPKLSESWPMVCNSMHAWYETPFLSYTYDELRRRLALMRSLEDVWHCNQNEYAAYRRQYRAARLTVLPASGDTVQCVLERPALLSLNDPTPLTIVVSGVASTDVLEAACDTADVLLLEERGDSGRLIEVAHDAVQQLPTKIGWIANPNNAPQGASSDSDGDFAALAGRLWVDGDRLRLFLNNGSGERLQIERLAWRAPLGWTPGAEPEPRLELLPGRALTIQTRLEPTGDPSRRIGEALFVAEVDFTLGGEAGRLFFTCRQAGHKVDRSYPRDGFALLGPISAAEFNRDSILSRIEAGGTPASIETNAGRIAWRHDARDGYVRHDWLNPEYVRTSGSWDANAPAYLLRSRVESPVAQRVGIRISHPTRAAVFVNGRRAEGSADLRAGRNELLIVYPPAELSPATTRLTACFVRLFDPSTGERLKDLRYSAE